VFTGQEFMVISFFSASFVSFFFCFSPFINLFTLCTTSRNVAGSILDGAFEIFYSFNSSARTMALMPTQLLTEKSTRDVTWGVKAAGA
jgi:hypothetical protein